MEKHDVSIKLHVEEKANKNISNLKTKESGSAGNNLSKEWIQRATEEINEDPESIEGWIASLRTMVLAEPDIHIRTDDAFLLRFLRAKKYHATKAFLMLKQYYTMKMSCPELFRIPRPSEKVHILEMQFQNMLEDRDTEGRRVYIFRVDKCDSSQVTIEDIFRTNVLALESVVDEPETQIAGIVVIVDMNGFGLQHAKFLSPYYAKKTVEVVQDTFPLRFRGFHIINQPFYFDAMFTVMRPFLKEKTKRRIFFHGRDLSSLHAHVSPDILPLEYGGKKPSFDNKAWRLALVENEDKLLEIETIDRSSTTEERQVDEKEEKYKEDEVRKS